MKKASVWFIAFSAIPINFDICKKKPYKYEACLKIQMCQRKVVVVRKQEETAAILKVNGNYFEDRISTDCRDCYFCKMTTFVHKMIVELIIIRTLKKIKTKSQNFCVFF